MSREFDSILGKQGKDKITGFAGTITQVVVPITGSKRYCIIPSSTKEEKAIYNLGVNLLTEGKSDPRTIIEDKAVYNLLNYIVCFKNPER